MFHQMSDFSRLKWQMKERCNRRRMTWNEVQCTIMRMRSGGNRKIIYNPERAAPLKFYFLLFSTMLCDVFYSQPAMAVSERSID
jgi:hypothetical protein